jgi:hypothetical protein
MNRICNICNKNKPVEKFKGKKSTTCKACQSRKYIDKDRKGHNANRRSLYIERDKKRVLLENKKYIQKPEIKNRYNLRISCINTILNSNESPTWEKRWGESLDIVRMSIENKFEKGMNWGNYGKDNWVISFIEPLSKFDLSKESQIKKAFAITNIRPLWYKEVLKIQNKKYV